MSDTPKFEVIDRRKRKLEEEAAEAAPATSKPEPTPAPVPAPEPASGPRLVVNEPAQPPAAGTQTDGDPPLPEAPTAEESR